MTYENLLTTLIGKEVISSSDVLRQVNPDLHFILESNGISINKSGSWESDNTRFIQFGILNSDYGSPFPSKFIPVAARAFNQEKVLDVVRKFRGIDIDSARRICALLGDVVLVIGYPSLFYTGEIPEERITKAVEFTARMTKLGGQKSGEAIAASTIPYMKTYGAFREIDPNFQRKVYLMSEAIEEDPVLSFNTNDLGISQALRLKKFLKKDINSQADKNNEHLPFSPDDPDLFVGFPTIGGEFHIPDLTDTYPSFWERLTILNMSQYQKGSPVPFSEQIDRLTEVRMNPTIYPFATATWQLMKRLLPELNNTYFTITINRDYADFNRRFDDFTVEALRTIGSLVYAAFFKDTPEHKNTLTENFIYGRNPEEIKFGNFYLGQTVKLKNKKYELTGNARTQDGQLNLYIGFGDLFPYLAYYLSMALVEPKILGFVSSIARLTPQEAIKVRIEDIQRVFQTINDLVANSGIPREATERGQKFIDELTSLD